MVGTAQDAGAAGALDHQMAAVLADVVETAQFVVAAADHEQILVEQGEGDVIARRLELAGVAGELPGPHEDFVPRAVVDRSVGVITPIERPNRAGADFLIHRDLPPQEEQFGISVRDS